MEALSLEHGASPSYSAETINDGQFHTVELVTFDQMVNLSIDGGSPMTMDNFGKHYTLNSEAPLYVGGEHLALFRMPHWDLGSAGPGQGLCHSGPLGHSQDPSPIALGSPTDQGTEVLTPEEVAVSFLLEKECGPSTVAQFLGSGPQTQGQRPRAKWDTGALRARLS